MHRATANQDPRLIVSEVNDQKYPVLVTRFAVIDERLVPLPKDEIGNASASTQEHHVTSRL